MANRHFPVVADSNGGELQSDSTSHETDTVPTLHTSQSVCRSITDVSVAPKCPFTFEIVLSHIRIA